MTTNRIINLINDIDSFPYLVELHLATVKGTHELEAYAEETITTGFSFTYLQKFITKVHEWGGSSRNLYKVLENARPSQFSHALEYLNANPPLVEHALATLLEIRGLGISYGSKHLRFLRPKLCPILDNVVWEQFKYPWDTRGYRILQREVVDAARILEKKLIHNPMARPNGEWFAADIDMAIFAFLQRKSKKCGW